MTTSYDPSTVVVSPSEWVAEQARRYEESGGTEGADLQGAPCLLLDYQGRRSGTWRRTVLIYVQEDGDYFIVASKGGAPEHPLWYGSIVANPEVHVRVGAERFTARAETLTAQQKAQVWPLLLQVWPDYEQYQKRTEREIPVVRLRRV
jgi:deazaflavin-dependent oxidoreductase (nitroreductase family)